MEEWRKVPGARHLEVSSKGRIKRLSRMSEKGTRMKEKILSLEPSNDGRLRVGFYDGRDRLKQEELHRLVAKTFIDNPNSYFYVNHKNGDRSDNSVSNLEWINNAPNRAKSKEKAVVGKDSNGVVQMRFDSITEGKRNGYTGIMFSLRGKCKCKGLNWFYE